MSGAGRTSWAGMPGRVPHGRFLMFLGLCLVGTLAVWPLGAARAVVVGFDIATLAFAASCLPLWRNDRLEAIRARAARDDGGRVLLLITAAVVIGAVLTALVRMIAARQTASAMEIGLVLATLLLAWIFANLVYAFHYAHLYYDDEEAGAKTLEFPGEDPPLFADFCYFSFVLGMTFQVSDVVIRATPMRRVATVHGVFAFFFNLGVLALTINVLAGAL